MTAHVSKSHFRVRYAETDQMGVVYYANYFIWMEIGRSSSENSILRSCLALPRVMASEEMNSIVTSPTPPIVRSIRR